MKNKIAKGFFCSLAVLLAGESQLTLAQRTWDGEGANENWSTALNWSGNGVPNNELVRFDDTAGTGTTTLVDSAFSNSISHLRYSNTSGTHTTDLQNNTLALNNNAEFYVGRNVSNSAAVIQNGTLDVGQGLNLRVGDREGGTNGFGSLTLENVRLVSDQLGYMLVGRNMDTNGAANGIVDLSGTTAGSLLHVRNGWRGVIGYGHRADGTLILSSNPAATNVIGVDAGTPVDFRVGSVNDGTANADGEITRGTLDAGSGEFHGRHSYFLVGHNDYATGAAQGSADFSGVAAGSTIDTYGWETRIGFGRQAVGTVALGPSVRMSVGQSAAQHAGLRIGDTFGRNADGMNTTGIVTAVGAEFHLHGDYFYVGHNDQNTGAADGTVDLSDAAAGSSVDTYGWETRIGAGRQAHGRLMLNTNVCISVGQSEIQHASFHVGNSLGRNAAGASTTGSVTAAGAEFHLHGDYFYVGHNDQSTGAAEGTVDLSDAAAGSSIDTYGWETRIGAGRQAHGTLMLNTNVRISVGQSESQHASFHVGNSLGRNAAGVSTTGSVTAAGAEFHLHGDYFCVGQNDQTTGAADGTVDLSDAAAGSSISTYGWETRIGFGKQARGTLVLSTNDMTVALGTNTSVIALCIGDSQGRNGVDETTVGILDAQNAAFSGEWGPTSIGVNGATNGSASGLLDLRNVVGGTINTHGGECRIGFGRLATGELLLSDSLTVSIGQTNNRAWLRVGDSESRNAAADTTVGTVMGNGAEFSAHLTSLFIGHNDRDGSGSVTGVVDCSTASGGTVTTSGNQTRIGFGHDAYGSLLTSTDQTLCFGDSLLPTWLRVGDTEGRNLGEDQTTGLLLAGGGQVSAHLSNVFIGHNDRAGVGVVTGTVDWSSAADGTVTTYGNQTRIGFGRKAEGCLLLSPNQAVTIGQPGQTTWLRVGDAEGRNEVGVVTTGELSLNGAAFSAHLGNIMIGQNVADAGAVTGLVDAADSATGSVRTIGGETRIGFGRNANGTLALGASDDAFGTSTAPTWLRVGESESRVGTLTRGVLSKAGGSVAGWFSPFHVGRNSGNSWNTVEGTVDLSLAAIGIDGINISGEVRIGDGRNATGVVKLPAGAVSVDGLCRVGDSDALDETGGTGYFELDRTTLSLASLQVGESGAITCITRESSSGLDLTGDPLDYTLLNTTLVFWNPNGSEDAYWGIRIAGSHTDWLQGLVDTGAITVDRSNLYRGYTVEVFEDESYTYLGIRSPRPPPPDGILILVK